MIWNIFKYFRKPKAAGFITVAAIAFSIIVPYEGLRTKAYLDPVGIATICYGSTHGVKIGDVKTPEECRILLETELKDYIAAVDRIFPYPMPDTRRAALVSLAYNIGPGALERSTLARKMHQGDIRGACEEFGRWIYAGGKKFEGLVRRRAAEQKLCLEGI